VGLLDKVKGALRGKGAQVTKGIDKVADAVDDKTGHKHSDAIDGVADKAKGVVDKLDDSDG
jgi:ABC-type transporter Mla subunit MlaD